MSEALKKLREPFQAHQISKLPKETKAQKEARDGNRALGINCKVCGGWHHKDTIHLDYVGHAALTDRLLDVDPLWFWEPCAFGEDGLPQFDKTGGLWIRLHVAGHSRLGYGHAAPATFKEIGSREKEVIGDALRNAAMRFGAALDLWHKGDLHLDDEVKATPGNVAPQASPTAQLKADIDALDPDTRATAETFCRKWRTAFEFDKSAAYDIYLKGMAEMVNDATAQSALKGLVSGDEKKAFGAIKKQRDELAKQQPMKEAA